MSNLMTAAVGLPGSPAQVAASRPISRSAGVEEASSRLRLDHVEFEASLERLRAFMVAGDAELARGEWDELEGAILRHIDAEEMFLLPAFAREEPVEAATLQSEHAEVRRHMGEIGVALDLHTLRLEQIDEMFRAVARHIARESRTLYAWADQGRNRPLLDAIARRIPRAFPDGSPDSRATTTLLALLRVCRDGEQGYRRANLDAEDADHQAMFGRLAEERARFAREIREQLKGFGVTAQFKGTVFGAIHRGWIEASSKLTHGRARLILRECERGEELALRAYRAALRTDLPPAVRGYVEAQRREIERAIGDLRALAATAT
jgi:uncharacterized protein (TIGR02284 family)